MIERASIRPIVTRILHAILGILAITTMLVGWTSVDPIATMAVLSIAILPVSGTWIFISRRKQRQGNVR